MKKLIIPFLILLSAGLIYLWIDLDNYENRIISSYKILSDQYDRKNLFIINLTNLNCKACRESLYEVCDSIRSKNLEPKFLFLFVNVEELNSKKAEAWMSGNRLKADWKIDSDLILPEDTDTQIVYQLNDKIETLLLPKDKKEIITLLKN